ncbi:MAG: hypothetical protein CO093_11720 [Alphaproteobacteria bacterium CG_4_9_14_3_um_filter_47_13]|nr:MAG: hypothetical protein CO093_11720 [Alphaproteobacteria bacterium CG_4_9_14_3_um_filter_47_13]
MNDECKSFSRKNQHGNAMIYVLIVVALFGALSFVLARQTDNSESGALSSEKTEIYASTLLQATMQLKQAVEQMTFTGTQITDLDFITSDDASFDVGSPVNKVFHPHGGGVILPRIPDEAINEISADPPARWYIGRFNNMAWTPSTANDVILTAHQIKQDVCARINEKLTGSPTIPELAVHTVKEVLINASESTAGGNFELNSAECAVCDGKPALCVKDKAVNAWSFYSLIATE